MKKGVKIWALIVVLVIIGSVFSGMVGAANTSANLTNNTTNTTEETLLLQESWIAQSSDLFKVTVGEYSETADLDQAIKNEYGDDYRLADWNDVLAYSNDIQNWASSIGMEHGDSYLISRDGNRFWSGRRHYFMTRHDHNCPGSFLVHDDIDNHFIDLGSWYNLEMHVLCIKTTTPTPPSGDSYEPDDTYSQATLIPTDGTHQTHNFEPAGDHDWVKFTAVSGTEYTIETSNLGSGSDTFIYLYARDGTTEITHNDDHSGLASRIVWNCPTSGTYYVMIRHYDSSSHGPDTQYDISITGPPSGEPGSSFDNTITIYREGSVGDKLSEGESIYYKIWLNKEKDVTLALDFGSLTDIVHNPNLDIYLYNPLREQVSASIGENWNAYGVDEQMEYDTGSEDGYYYIKIVNLRSHPHYEPEEFSLDVDVSTLLPPPVIEPTPVLLGTYSLEPSAPGSKIIDGNIGEIKIFGSSSEYRIEIELDTPVVSLYNAELQHMGDYDIPLTFRGSGSMLLLSFDEKVHMDPDSIAFYDADGNQIEQGGGLFDSLLSDIIMWGLGMIIPLPIPTSTIGTLLESQDKMLVSDILSNDITHDMKSVIIAPKRSGVKKVVVFISKDSEGTPVDNTLHLYAKASCDGYAPGLSPSYYVPPVVVGTKYINDIPLVS